MKSQPDFKAIASARSKIYGVDDATLQSGGWRGLNARKESGGGKTKYEVNAVEDAIVEGHSQVELAGTIEAYQLEVSGSKTTSKSMTAHKTENKSHRQD